MPVACLRKLWSQLSLWCMRPCCSSEDNCLLCVLLCNKPCYLLVMRNVTFWYFLLCMNLYILLLFNSASKACMLRSQISRLFHTSAFRQRWNIILKREELRLESCDLFIYRSTQCYLETLYESFKGILKLNMQIWGKSYIHRSSVLFLWKFLPTFQLLLSQFQH